MIGETLRSIDHVGIYAIIGFFIFFIFFILVAIHTVKMDKEKTRRFSHLPLDDNKEQTS
ncbi:hypothetical protein [Gaoshiqia sp. Z1-71]|uniref:hypothetical protein n=1 Tax=Gaoshiqia hydrogeniformans TaxID=3290090 RepID=UPI003BF81519